MKKAKIQTVEYNGAPAAYHSAVAGPTTLVLFLTDAKLEIAFLEHYPGFADPALQVPVRIIKAVEQPKRSPASLSQTHTLEFQNGSTIPAHIRTRPLATEDRMLLRAQGAQAKPPGPSLQPASHAARGQRPVTTPPTHGRSQYDLRKDLNVWPLLFNGQPATIKDCKGIHYVSCLLKHPLDGPLHAIDLVARALLSHEPTTTAAEAIHPDTGKPLQPDAAARTQDRSHSLDDAVLAKRIQAKQQEWEAVLDDQDATEPEKAEAQRKILELEAFQKTHSNRSRSSADKLVRAVRAAITRLHDQLAKATDEHRKPHPVLRAFAEHIAKYIITPSARYSGHVHSAARAGLAGRFTYEPPPGVKWSG